MSRYSAVLAVLVSAFAAPATASFHFMQIEQAIGGVNGDTSVQAVQLRMRNGGQNLVNGTRLVAYDATGNNPVVLVTMGADVANGASGSRILLASAAFASNFSPTPDFILSNLIPPAYLTAGRLTFEDGGGTIYWSLAWGGGVYTGSNAGSTTNDADGDFGPPTAAPLPSAGGLSLLFQGTAAASSTSNAADYSVTASEAFFINNAGDFGTPVPVELQHFSVD